MPEYTVRNPATNKTITFRWNDAAPPTDADIDEIFAEADATVQPDFRTEVKASEGVVDGPSAIESYLVGTDGGPSVAGFAKNVVTSGLGFAKDLATPFLHPQETYQGLKALVTTDPTLTGKLIKDAVLKRYGSVDAFLGTLYNDPVGAASDASLMLGGASATAKGLGAGRNAARIGQIADALNPLAVPAKGMETVGRATYGAAINPSRRIRRGFPGAIDEGYKRNVLPTEGGLARTERALEQSAAHTDDLLRQADAAGAPGVNVRTQITPALAEPMKEARRRARLGKSDETGDVAGRARVMASRNQRKIPLTEANLDKRSAQTLADNAFRAQERGALIKDIEAMSDLKVADAYKKAIEANAASVGIDGVGESNRMTQSLIGLAQALEDATQQPSRLTHLMSTLGAIGGGIASGVPGGAGAYVAGRLATAKPVMAGAGLAVGKGNKVVRNAQIVRALAVMRALEQQPQEQQHTSSQRP